MLRVVEKEEYLDTSGVLEEFGASKKRFYKNIKPYLRVYHFDAKKTPWYRHADVLALKSGKIARKANIAISSIFSNWTVYLRSLGFHDETNDLSVEISTLPEDAVQDFHLSADEKFIKRTRMSLVDGQPICVWDTYYPLSLTDDLYDGMKQGTVHDIPRVIKERRGVSIGYGHDKTSTRMMSFDEQNRFRMLNDTPVLIVRRVAQTQDRSTLVFYQHMVLLGNWFSTEHEYDVKIWGE